MKAVKVIVGIALAGFVLIAVALTLAFLPSVQTWAARKAVGGLPGTLVSLGRVSASLSSASVDGLRIVQGGRVVSVDKVTARYSAWDYLLHHRVTVDDLTVDGVLVDLRKPATAPQTTPSARSATAPASSPVAETGTPTSAENAASPQAPFDGVLRQLVIPVDLHVASAQVKGRALLPGGQTAAFEVRIHNLSTGSDGTLTWTAWIANPLAAATFHTAQASGTVKIRISPDRHVDAIDLSAIASAVGPDLPTDQIRLTASATRSTQEGDEDYAIACTDVHDGASDTLFSATSRYDSSAKRISGTWKAALQGERVSAFARGFKLPEVSITGDGAFGSNPDAQEASTSGTLEANLSHLERVSPAFAGIGELSLHLSFDTSLANQIAKLNRLSILVDDAHGIELARINTLQPVAISLSSKTVSLQDPRRELASIAFTNLPLAWAQPLSRTLTIDSGALSLAFGITATPDGRDVRLSPLLPLTVTNLTLRSGAKPLVAGLNLSVKPSADYSSDTILADIADLVVSTPAGDHLAGKIQIQVSHPSAKPVVTFSSSLQSRIVAALKPYLSAPTGTLELAINSTGSLSGQSLRLTHASVELSQEAGTKLVSFALLQPLVIDTATTAVAAETPGRNAISLELSHIPLSWAEAYLPNSALSGEFAGATFEVGLRSLQDLSVETKAPISLRGVGVTLNGKSLLKDADLTVNFSATDRANVVRYEVQRFELTGNDAPLAKLAVAGTATLGGKLNATAKGNLHVDLATLMRQPTAPAGAALASGNLDISFDAALADVIRATAKLTIRNLVSANDRQSLGDVDLGVDASLGGSGADRLHIPFTLTKGGRTSDLLVDGTLLKSSSGISFDGQVTSKQLYTDDLQTLAALAPQGAPAQAGAQPADANSADTVSSNSTPKRDTHPFWDGAGGKLQLRLDHITYGATYVISGVHGSADVTPVRLALDSLEGSLNTNPFKVAASVDFDSAKPQPYTLTASTTVSNFDVGAFLQAADPNDPPQLESKVTLGATLEGQGSNVVDLTQNIRGKFDMSGSKGLLRALSKKGGNAVSVASSLVGLFGAATGSQGTVAVADLAKKLNELNFDSFSFHAERGTDMNLKVSKIEFVSPDTRLTGSGQITYQRGTPIQNQSMQFTLQLAGKDQMAYLLSRAKLLSGQQDDQGYSTMATTFTLGGTPTKPDSSDLWRIMGQAALGAGLGNQLGKFFGH